MYDFPILKCETPAEWVVAALKQQHILLIDHAHCEKKAASTALSLLYRYPEHTSLLTSMSRLAREELRHFEQVVKLLKGRNIPYQHLSPSRYAKAMLEHARTTEPEKLIDTLIIGAFVEARSCERFSKLVPHLDEELSKFYKGLLACEARHYEQYLTFARSFSDENIDERIEFFSQIEKVLIESEDSQFRFHSGCPIAA